MQFVRPYSIQPNSSCNWINKQHQKSLKMIKLNHVLSLRKMVENVCNIVICKSLKPYIYEMSCFLYSGKYSLTLSKMNYMLYNLFTLNKVTQHRKNKILKIKIHKKTMLKSKITTVLLEFRNIFVFIICTIDIVIIIGLLCNSKVLFKNQQQKIQATYTYEKLQHLKKNHDF